MLSDNESGIRQAAVAALGNIRDPAAIPPLAGCFADPAPEVRTAASRALAGMGAAALAPVIGATEDTRAPVRIAALETLGQMRGAFVLRSLIRSLGDDDEQVRQVVSKILVRLAQDPHLPVFDVLTDIMAQADTNIRFYALEAIAGMHDLRALDLIYLASYDPEESIRNKAQEILSHMDEATVTLLEAAPEVPASTDEIARLIAALAGNDEKDRRAAAEKLLLIGKPAVAPLISSIRDANDRTFASICSILENMEESITAELTGALASEAPAVRLAAVALLNRAGDRRTVPALDNALISEPEAGIRKAIADALGNLRDSQGIMPLVSVLNDRDPAVRLTAIRSLGRIHERRVIIHLIRQLDDEDEEIIWTVAEALQMQGADARDPLTRALREGSHHSRAMAASVLEYMDMVPEDPVDKAYYLVGKEHWYEASSIGTDALAPLMEAASDGHTHIRLGAVNAIGRVGSTGAVLPLVTALNDDSPLVRKRAEIALVTIGQPSVAILRNSLESGSARFPDTTSAIIRKIGPVADDPAPPDTGSLHADPAGERNG